VASIGVFTIASKNYLAYVRTMLNSVARVHPEYKLYLCLADQVDDYFEADQEPYTVIQADQLGIHNFTDMTLRYDIMEFNTAVKPFMFRWLFDNTDLDTVIYLDPDTRAYSRFDRLESVLESGASVVLTPHITKPLEDGKNPNDYHMLQAGVFNLGFIAARRCSETLDFMDWWGRRLSAQCIADHSASLFVDQKWCDLAPCFLDNLNVFKDPCYNVAYWNLAQRQVTESFNGEWQVNGSSLAFFHFSGINVDKRHIVSKHQNRFGWDDIQGCQSLFEHYLDELVAYGWNMTRNWPYAYSSVSGKLGLSVLLRRLYRLSVPQPISLVGIDVSEYLVDLCNQADEKYSGKGGVQITRLMSLVYQLRPDVQAAFGLSTPEGRRQFIAWFEVAGEREYGLPHSLTHSALSQGSSISSDGSKKSAAWCYRILIVAEEPARKLSKYLPVASRRKAKSLWLRIKDNVLRAF